MKTQRTSLVIGLVAGLAIAACSSGESVITSGNDPEPTAAEEPAAEPGDAPADEPGAAPADDSDGTDDGPDDTGGTGGSDDVDDTSGGTDDGPDTTEPDPLAGLPGCPTEALEAAEGPIDVTFWHGLNVENEEALQALTDAYNSGQSKVRVNIENQGSYLDTIDEYFQSGEGSRPDIVMFPEYTMRQAIDSGTVLPAGACVRSSGFDTSPLQPAVLQAYSAGGALWGMPFNVSVPVLYYRKDLVNDPAVAMAAPPASFAELRTLSQTLADALGVYGIAIDSDIDNGGGWFIEEWFAAANVEFADADNGRSGQSATVFFDGDFGVELLTFFQQMVDDELAFYVGDNASGSDHFLKLADPDRPATMTIGTSAALGSVIAALGGGLVPGLGPEDVGLAPMPTLTGETGVIVGGAANYLVAGKDDEVTAAAWDYLTYLVQPEVQSQWTVDTGYMPLRDDALEFEPAKTTFEEDPRYRVAYDSLAASVATAGTGPLLGPHRQIRTELANAVAAIMTGADVQSSLAAAATLAQAYLSDYSTNN